MPTASATVTRPNDTTAYAAFDVVGGAVELPKVAQPEGGLYVLRGLSLRIDAASIIASETSYRIHFYSVTPPSAQVDNAAFDLAAGDRASYLGYLDTGNVVDLGATLWAQLNDQNMPMLLVSGSVFAVITTTAGHTPTALRDYTLTVHTEKAQVN